MALEMHSKELRGGTYLAPIFMATMLVALVLPMFFEVYRTVYYGTMSYDDYSRYLLWVLGEPGGKIPPSPHVYRIGSVILAAPFYQLPVILFSGQGIHHAPVVMQPEYVRALQAMCAANAAYAAVSACLVGIYLAFFLFMASTRAVLLRLVPDLDLGVVSLIVTAAGVTGPVLLFWTVRRTPLAFLFRRPHWARLASPGRRWHSVPHGQTADSQAR